MTSDQLTRTLIPRCGVVSSCYDSLSLSLSLSPSLSLTHSLTLEAGRFCPPTRRYHATLKGLPRHLFTPPRSHGMCPYELLPGAMWVLALVSHSALQSCVVGFTSNRPSLSVCPEHIGDETSFCLNSERPCCQLNSSPGMGIQHGFLFWNCGYAEEFE